MARLLFISGAIAVAFVLFAFIDLLMTDRRRIRALNKPIWALVIIVIPVIGAILWFVLGKARRSQAAEVRMVAPDDDPRFLQNLALKEDTDERIRRLEQELADLDDDPPAP
jgi:Phospholipase_D-nuclease N-terminal